MDCVNGFERLEKEVAVLVKNDAYDRLSKLFDNGSFTELDRFAKNGENGSGVITAYGSINGIGAYAFSQDVSVLNGAMGRAQAAKIKKLYDLALKNGAPIVGIYDSKGAFVEEGIDALNAYGELIAASGNISGVVPQIAVIAGTCVGSAAIMASVSDVVISLKDAKLCVNSSAITGDKNTGSASVNAKAGTVAVVCDDMDMAANTVASILAQLPENNLSLPTIAEYVPAVCSGEGVYSSISMVVDADSFLELWKEFGFCAKVGFARVAGNSVGIVATDSDKNDAKLCGNGAAKIARFVRLCDAFSVPVVTLVDCAGFMGGADDELDGSVKAVAALTAAYAEATTAKVAVIVGKAYGCAFTAMAGLASGSDVVLALADSAISALEPATAVQFIYKDRLQDQTREELEKEYILTVASPFEAAKNGAVTDIVTKEEIAQKIIIALDMLASKRVSTLEKKHSNMPI